MEIKIKNTGGDYISVEINGNEKELHLHDGKTIKALLKVIINIFKAYE